MGAVGWRRVNLDCLLGASFGLARGERFVKQYPRCILFVDLDPEWQPALDFVTSDSEPCNQLTASRVAFGQWCYHWMRELLQASEMNASAPCPL